MRITSDEVIYWPRAALAAKIVEENVMQSKPTTQTSNSSSGVQGLPIMFNQGKIDAFLKPLVIIDYKK
ncbi:hypothetical protein QR680_006824 [Steinernema hermaphroditum]|uniref:Uncharacterized protein n=1 Tax=Steinernema hermaphroditum TaxID=289476 RepID=A0AA39HWQ9_9BILA|nr:hypothetical protein QR680_006824 [Steinernema hermaphroditum]